MHLPANELIILCKIMKNFINLEYPGWVKFAEEIIELCWNWVSILFLLHYPWQWLWLKMKVIKSTNISLKQHSECSSASTFPVSTLNLCVDVWSKIYFLMLCYRKCWHWPHVAPNYDPGAGMCTVVGWWSRSAAPVVDLRGTRVCCCWLLPASHLHLIILTTTHSHAVMPPRQFKII